MSVRTLKKAHQAIAKCVTEVLISRHPWYITEQTHGNGKSIKRQKILRTSSLLLSANKVRTNKDARII